MSMWVPECQGDCDCDCAPASASAMRVGVGVSRSVATITRPFSKLEQTLE